MLVVVDDLEANGAPYWDAMPSTRELIADRGTEFENAFANSPSCCPARATILSGQYPHNTGVFSASDIGLSPEIEQSDTAGGSGIEIFARDAEKHSIGVRLGNAGYRTAFIGKYLNGYERRADYVPPGWDEWFGLGGSFLDGFTYVANHNGIREMYGSDEDDYQTDVLARKSVQFVDSAEEDDSVPFLLTVWPSAPHAPLKAAPRHRDHEFADDDLPTSPNFNEPDVSDKPSWLREGVQSLDEEGRARQTGLYRNGMGSLLAVDEMITDLVVALEEHDELDDTVFVFTSDNGYNRGAHRLEHKMAPYEESIRVPLAIAGPGIQQGTDENLAAHVDLAPTLFDLAGMELPDDVDGLSLVPLLEGVEAQWRTEVLVEFEGRYNVYVDLHTAENVQSYLDGQGTIPYVPTYRALRDENYLYVEWYAGDLHEYELYDLEKDPYQLTNLLAAPDSAAEHASTATARQERLSELAVCAGAACH